MPSPIATNLVKMFRRALYSYQSEWWVAAFDQRDIGQVGARQIGKTDGWSGFPVFNNIMAPHTTWNCFSATDRHAQRFISDCEGWYLACDRVAKGIGFKIPGIAANNARSFEFDNGSVIHAHASTRRASVGLRGNVFQDEVGVIPHAAELYDAIRPIIVGARYAGKDARHVIFSNASARGTWWHEWWTGDRSAGFHKITSDFESCMLARGWTPAQVKIERDKLLRTLGPHGYMQWYECLWRSTEDGMFDSKLLNASSYDSSAPQSDGLAFIAHLFRRASKQVIGYDPGRKRDPAGIARALFVDGCWFALPTEAHYDMPWEDQIDRLVLLASQLPTVCVVVESNGVGDPQAESASKRLQCPVLEFHSNQARKWSAFATLKIGLETGVWQLPRGDMDLRMEMESVSIEYTAGGQRVTLPRTKRDGKVTHGDLACAEAFAAWGALQGRPSSVLDMF